MLSKLKRNTSIFGKRGGIIQTKEDIYLNTIIGVSDRIKLKIEINHYATQFLTGHGNFLE